MARDAPGESGHDGGACSGAADSHEEDTDFRSAVVVMDGAGRLSGCTMTRIGCGQEELDAGGATAMNYDGEPRSMAAIRGGKRGGWSAVRA